MDKVLKPFNILKIIDAEKIEIVGISIILKDTVEVNTVVNVGSLKNETLENS